MRRFAPLLAIVAVAASGCGGDTAAPATKSAASGAQKVEIKAFQFAPDPITVKADSEIEFANADATIHTIVGGTRKNPDKSVLDGETAQGETYTATLTEPGTYKYFCDRHSGPGMTAEIVVK